MVLALAAAACASQAPPAGSAGEAAFFSAPSYYNSITMTHDKAGAQGVCISGDDVWVTNFNLGTASRLRRSDGALLGEFPVGKEPYRCLADPQGNLWIGLFEGHAVKVLRPSDGQVIATYLADGGGAITSIGTDGQAMYAVDYNRQGVTRIGFGGEVGKFWDFSAQLVGNPEDIAFDGKNFWLAGANARKLLKFDPDGNVLGVYPTDGYAAGVAFDGKALWVSLYDAGKVAHYSLDGKLLGEFEAAKGAAKLVANAEYVFIPAYESRQVLVLRTSDGKRLFEVPNVWNCRTAALDGDTAWVTSYYGTGTTTASRVFKIAPSHAPRDRAP